MKEKISAIYDEDLSGLLEKEGELEQINNGNRFCKMCGTPIILENIQMVIPHRDSDYEYICEFISCVENYHKKLNTHD